MRAASTVETRRVEGIWAAQRLQAVYCPRELVQFVLKSLSTRQRAHLAEGVGVIASHARPGELQERHHAVPGKCGAVEGAVDQNVAQESEQLVTKRVLLDRLWLERVAKDVLLQQRALDSCHARMRR
eukprot:6211300-Prymnesium_polylepis.1